jgi:hypothetical protein
MLAGSAVVADGGAEVTAPLTHATVLGLAILQNDERLIRSCIAGERACDGHREVWGEWADTLIDSSRIKGQLPTCPACAVLRDAALEGRTQ